jgi:hypothetical protein
MMITVVAYLEESAGVFLNSLARFHRLKISRRFAEA